MSLPRLQPAINFLNRTLSMTEYVRNRCDLAPYQRYLGVDITRDAIYVQEILG